MANIKEHYLNEIKIHSPFLEDTLLAVLHTIMFVRAPIVSKAQDRMCETLSPLIYATVGPSDVDRDIKGTIDQFKRQFSSSSRPLRGEIVLSFFEHREYKEWIGLVTRHENVYFERWHVPVTVNDRNDHSSRTEREDFDYDRAYRTAYDQASKAMMAILEGVNHASDHMPLTLYNYELQVVEAADERRRSFSSSSGKLPLSSPPQGMGLGMTSGLA